MVRLSRGGSGGPGALALVFVTALLARLLPVLAGAGPSGVAGYDDGVYFGSALAMLHGRLPYRDFLFILPPGNVLALAPFAALDGLLGGAGAFGVARLAWIVIGAVNATLVAVVARRYAPRAGLVAGLLYAVWGIAVVGEHNTDLHAVQTLLVVLALLVLARRGRISWRRALVAGILLGLATSFQLWQGVTVAVLAWWVLVRAPRGWPRRLGPPLALGLAAIGAFLAACLPFLAQAPAAMLRQVIADQLGRPTTGVGLAGRLRSLEGIVLTDHAGQFAGVPPDAVVYAFAVALLLAGAVIARRLAWTRPWAVLAAAQAGVVLAVPSFHADYPAFVAPAACLLFGSGIGSLLWPAARERGWSRPLAVGVALGMGVLLVPSARPLGHPLAIERVRDAIPAGVCVAADSPVLLVVTGTLVRDTALGCPIVLDPTGTYYDAPRQDRFLHYQAAMLAWYGGAGALLEVRGREGLTPATRDALSSRLPDLVRIDPVIVRTRGS